MRKNLPSGTLSSQIRMDTSAMIAGLLVMDPTLQIMIVALARFNEWFGSMSLMNTLYVWFPASWGPSVVEAISKRNQKWLQQHPVHRDPAMFNPLEVENGPAFREMRYKIQKWNVSSKVVHPILVANVRVDWMSLDDSDITQQFEILREGILRDVFSQRASSAWQGMQPQRLTVSLLLPGMNSKADEWLLFFSPMPCAP